MILNGIAACICFIVMLPATSREMKKGVAGVTTNVNVLCDNDITASASVFWIINGSVYGLLQVPQGFSACGHSRISCNLNSLNIPVLLSEMDGFTFQCVSIDYHGGSQYLGEITVLRVSLPRNRNNSIQEEKMQRDDLNNPQFSVGPVNTTIGWTYSNLTCHPSVFTIQGYADRDDIPDNPSLNLTSTSSVLSFPTNITNGSRYWSIRPHDMAGTFCLQESVYFKDANESDIPISPASDGVGCVPIPVGPRRDYSSLEVVWPERRDTVGRLCYCPPFEGEHHLFSRCISTTSCDTDYSITVSNGSVCFAELSPPLTSIPVYFTLLESCTSTRCVIRSMIASFIIEMNGELPTNITPVVYPPIDEDNVATDTSTNFVDKMQPFTSTVQAVSENSSQILNTGGAQEPTGTITTAALVVSDTLIAATIMGALLLLVLLSCPPVIIIIICRGNKKIKQLQEVPSPPPKVAMQESQGPEYEDILELQASRKHSSSYNSQSAFTFTECSAYATGAEIHTTTPLCFQKCSAPLLHDATEVNKYEDILEVQTAMCVNLATDKPQHDYICV